MVDSSTPSGDHTPPSKTIVVEVDERGALRGPDGVPSRATRDGGPPRAWATGNGAPPDAPVSWSRGPSSRVARLVPIGAAMNRIGVAWGLVLLAVGASGCGDDDAAGPLDACAADAAACPPLPPPPPGTPPPGTPPPVTPPPETPPPSGDDAGTRPECIGARTQGTDVPSTQTVRFRLTGPAGSYVVSAGDACSPFEIERGAHDPVTQGRPYAPLCEGPPPQRPAPRSALALDAAPELIWDARELVATGSGCFDCGSGSGLTRYQTYSIDALEPVAAGRYRATFAILDAVDGALPLGCSADGGMAYCAPTWGMGFGGGPFTICPASRFVTVELDLPASGDVEVPVEIPPVGSAADGEACGTEAGASCGADLSCCAGGCTTTCPSWQWGCYLGCEG